MSRLDKQTYIFNLINYNGTIKRDDIFMALQGSSGENVISYYLDELVRLGLIVKDGETYALAR